MPTGPRPEQPLSTVRVSFSGSYLGDTSWVNVMYLSTADAGAGFADAVDLALHLGEFWNSHFNPALSSSLALEATAVRWLDAEGDFLDAVHDSANFGSLGEGIDAAQACAVVNWQIGRSYRGGHPRNYITGVPASEIVGGRKISADFRAGLAAGASDFMAAVNGFTTTNSGAIALGTVSFQAAGDWRIPPVFEPYISASVREVLGTQRRRLGGR